MNHPLQEKIRAVTRRLQRLVLGAALARVLGWTLLAVLVLGSADYLIRFQDTGIRLICSLVVLATLVWTGLRYPLRAWRHRLSELTVAQRVERVYPELQGRVACALEFLQQEESDPLAGSASLRRSVISSATADAQERDFSRVVNPRPFRRVFFLAGALVLIIAIFTLLDAKTVWTATVRLSQPFGQHDWPRKNRLQWVDPPQSIASGSPFAVELIDENGRLPEEVTIHYRYQDENGTSQEEEFVRATETPSGPKIIAVKDGVIRSFSFRAEGGDDNTMPWHDLEVVDPPQLVSRTMTLYPPEYTGVPPYPADLRIRALPGARVDIKARADKPLRAAWLVTSYGEELPAKLSSQGSVFSISKDQMIVRQTGTYWFRLEDQSGISDPHPDRWDLECLVDSPPSVSIRRPKSDTYATPGATIPLQIKTKDDLAIRSVELLTSVESRAETTSQTVPLWTGPPQIDAEEIARRHERGEVEDQRSDDYALNLRDFTLQPGDQLIVLAKATDYLKQEKESAKRRIHIISPSDFQTRVAKRQEIILNRMAQVLQWQREAQTRTRSVETGLRNDKDPLRDKLNDLQSSEVKQRQVQQALNNSTDGIPAEIALLLGELGANHVKSPQIETALRRLSLELSQLSQKIIPPVQNDLTAAIKSLRSQSADAPVKEAFDSLVNKIDSVAAGQEKIVVTLEQLLGDFEGWADRRQLLLEVKHLQEQQRLLITSTATLAIKQHSTRTNRDKQQERESHVALSQRQKDTARRYDRFEFQMKQLSQRLKQESTQQNSPIHSALENSLRLGIAARMREASRRIEQAQAGRATEIQRQAVDDLQNILDTLAGQREPAARRRLQELQSVHEELLRLQETQAGLRDKLSMQQQFPPGEESPTQLAQRRQQLMRLRKEQQRQTREIDKLVERLKRLEAQQAAERLQQASDSAEASNQALGQEDPGTALDHAQEATEKLDDAQNQLAQEIKKAKSDLDQLASIKLEEEVQGLLLRQQSLITETNRLNEQRKKQSEWSRLQATSVQDVAKQQSNLAEDAQQLGKTLSVAPVFELALTEYQSDASLAANLLEKLETGAPTQEAQDSGARRLRFLLASLSEKNRRGLDTENNKPDDGASGQDSGQPSSAQSYELAQLKLLKALQEDLNRRTRQHEVEFISTAEPSAELRDRSAELQLEQGRLAEIATKLATPAESAEDQNPEQLPDLHEQLKELEADDDDLPSLDLIPTSAEEN